MTDYILSSSESNAFQNHDGYKVIWFGSRNYGPKELRNFTDYIDECYTFEGCDNHIKNVRSEHRILLVFTDFYQHLSYFNNLLQVQSIYILKTNSSNLKYEKVNYSKLIDSFTDERASIERLCQDILLTLEDSTLDTLMSTTRDKIIAATFIAGAEVGVILEINIDSARHNIYFPFADISEFSSMTDEKEVLFFAGTIFRMDSVELQNDSTWIVKLTLSEHALLCYEHALRILIVYPVRNRDVATIYRKISDIHRKQNNHEVTIIYETEANELDKFSRQRSDLNYKDSLNDYQDQSNLSSYQCADIFYSIDVRSVQRKGDYSQALEKFFQANRYFINIFIYY